MTLKVDMTGYTPIGECEREITECDGRSICSTIDPNWAVLQLDFVKQHFPDAYIATSTITNGHTNRDGEYRESSHSYWKIVRKVPYYSSKDSQEAFMKAFNKYLKEKGFRGFKNGPATSSNIE